MSEVLKAELLPLETKIENELVKQNVTEKLIAKLKADYMPLTIAGQHDREGYEAIVAARKDCKRWRILAKNICENGRESAIAEQKLWIAKQKDVTDKISEVEDYLEKQEKDFEEERDRLKAEKKRQQEAAFLSRSVELTKMGASFDGTSFTLEEVSYEAVLLKEADEDVYATMFAKYKTIFDKNQQAAAELEESRADAAAKLELERAELKNLRKEREELQAQIKADEERREKERKDADLQKFQFRLAQLEGYNYNGLTVSYEGAIIGNMQDIISIPMDEFEAKVVAHKAMLAEREEQRKKLEKANEERKAKQDKRISQLYELGLKFDFAGGYFVNYDVFIHTLDIQTFDDQKWQETMEKTLTHINEYKAAEAQRQKEKTETERNAAIEKALQREREKREEEARQEQETRQNELAKANDTQKWQSFLNQLSIIQVPEFKSSQYKNKRNIALEKIEDIKQL